MRILYFDILSLLLWMNRAVYIGIFLSAIWFYDKFFGEFNLLYPVSPILPYLTVAGLVFFEIGVILGNRKRSKRILQEKKQKKQFFNWFRSTTYLIPLFIWIVSVVISLILFSIKGIPLFEDPMLRSTMGIDAGILKRFMWVFLPVSCLELFSFTLLKKNKEWLNVIVIPVTFAIFLLLTFKGKIFFLALFLFLIYYKIRIFNKNSKINLFRIKKKYLVLSSLVLLFFVSVALYAFITPSSYSFLTTMAVRTTNLIAQSPNYIVSGLSGVPDAGTVLKNDVSGVLRTFRLPHSIEPKPIDTELTRIILNRDIQYDAGGLNPTVIGYGWMVGKWIGVCLLSILYGFLNILFFRSFLYTTNPCKIASSIFAIYILFCAVQIFSPIGTFMDTGFSLLGYILLHRLLEEFFGAKAFTQFNTKAAPKILSHRFRG